MSYASSDHSEVWEPVRSMHTTQSGSSDMNYHSSYASSSDYITTTESSPTQQFKIHTSPLSDTETIDVFRDAVENARELVHKQGENESIDAAVQPNLTLDLKRKGIESLPQDVVQIIKRDVERIVLSHNYISSLPPQFFECMTMQYLNLRGNRFTSFPTALLRMEKLQILDLSRNSIEALPEELKSMKALRVLSVMHNKLTSLPWSLGSLDSLRILKMIGNPLNEQLRTIIDSSDSNASPQITPIAENEKDALLTLKIKQFLRNELNANESGGESSSESPLETPRPLKRNTSIRFPVIPANGSSDGNAESRSPSVSKPPLPNRSHYRVTSSQNLGTPGTAFRRPSVSPLILGNERTRSNSENVLSNAPIPRNKRMGIVTRKTGLSPLEESNTNRNSLHLRGISHGSVLKDRHVQRGMSSRGSTAVMPPDHTQQPGTFIRRLSSVPEQKADVAGLNRTIEGAKGLLFSLHALHPYISSLLPLAAEEGSKRSSLERVFYNSSTRLDSLDHELHMYGDIESRNERRQKRALRTVCRACRACIVAYIQVGKLLLRNAGQILLKGDQRYIRMLLLLIYGSNIEATNAFNNLQHEINQSHMDPKRRRTDAWPREGVPKLTVRAMTPTQDRPITTRRFRGDTGSSSRQQYQALTQAHNKSATHTQSAVPLYINGRSRSNSRSNALNLSATSSVANTPASGESFFIPNTPAINSAEGIVGMSIDSNDAVFEKVYLSIQKFVDQAQTALPVVCSLFGRCHDAAQAKSENRKHMELWSRLYNRARQTRELCEALGLSLSTLKLNDLDVRKSMGFWNQVTRFTNGFVNLCDEIKMATATSREQMAPLEIQRVLKPGHKCVRIAIQALKDSPWSNVLANNATTNPHNASQWQINGHLTGSAVHRVNGHHRTRGSSGSSSSPYMPTTPLSAALGPAAQAIIPKPSSGSNSFDRSFQGDVFQRAEFALTMLNSANLHRRA